MSIKTIFQFHSGSQWEREKEREREWCTYLFLKHTQKSEKGKLKKNDTDWLCGWVRLTTSPKLVNSDQYEKVDHFYDLKKKYQSFFFLHLFVKLFYLLFWRIIHVEKDAIHNLNSLITNFLSVDVEKHWGMCKCLYSVSIQMYSIGAFTKTSKGKKKKTSMTFRLRMLKMCW